MTPTLLISKGEHRGKEIYKLSFQYNPELTAIIKRTVNATWSRTLSTWYMAHDEKLLAKVKESLNGKANIKVNNEQPEVPAISRFNNPDHSAKIMRFRQWMRSKRYSESTIGTYADALKTFLKYYVTKPVEEISNDDIVRFNNEYILAKHLSPSFQNQVVNAIKLFYKITESRELDLDLIHRPKRTKALPNVLSKEEVKLILSASRNLKHRAMLSLIYSCGLRRSELLNLKISDIDSKRGLVIIKMAKGRKDRIVPLSQKILVLLREYFVAYKPKYWLFEGQTHKEQYTGSSLSAVLKQALEQCGINKPVTLHWLRHSFATHLLENGTDLRYIQEILGHSRSTITEIYTHVSNKTIQKIISPFDYL